MKKSMAILLLSSLAGLAGPWPAAAQNVSAAQNLDVAVAVNEDNHVSKITLAELRKVFAGEKRSWPGGVPVKLIVRAPAAHERLVLLKLLGMSEREYKQYWTTQVFRGEAQCEPVAVFSNGTQKEALTAFPGAIVLVDAKDVKPGMKVLPVDGRMPGDKDYPLH